MNVKKLVQAGMASFAVLYIISFVWYGVIMEGYYAAQFEDVVRGDEDFSFTYITIGYLILGFLLAYVYPLGFKGGPTVKEGARFGLMMGVLIAIPTAFIYAGSYKFPLMALCIDGVYKVVEIIIGSIVIAKIYGALDAAQETPDE